MAKSNKEVTELKTNEVEQEETTMLKKIAGIAKDTAKKALPGFVGGILGGAVFGLVSSKFAANAAVETGMETPFEGEVETPVDIAL